jgi:ABC-2 type transport system ATP-binding protein
VIDIKDVTHAFGGKTALADVSFQVPAGKVMGLVGPNAAGKTTLIRTIVTLLRPRRGGITVAGIDVLRDPRRARAAIGYLPERATTYGELLAWEYVDFFAELAGLRGAARRKKVREALELAELSSSAGQPTQILSKGVRQRLALAAVTLHVPAVLVLDEPTDGLDPQSRERLLAQVRALADRGTTVLISSHVLAEIEQIADDVVILVQGRVQPSAARPAHASFAFRLRGEPDKAEQVLASLPEVRKTVRDGAWLRVDLREGVADAASCAAALVRAGLDIVELHEEREDLRHRFLRAVDDHKEAS